MSVALCGAKRPEQPEAIDEVLGWNLDAAAMQTIDGVVKDTVLDPIGPDYLAPARRTV